MQLIHIHHVAHLQVQTDSLPRHSLRPRQDHLSERRKLRGVQPHAQRRHLRGDALRSRVLQRCEQRRRVVLPQIVSRDPQGVKHQVAVAGEHRMGSRCDAGLACAALRRARGDQIDDALRRAPRRCPRVEHDGQHRRQPVGGAEPLAPPALGVEAVDVAADAQRHQEVDLGLELQHHHQVQPRVGVVFVPVAKGHAPDHVVGTPALAPGVGGDRLLVHARELREVERIDERTGAVEVGDEPAHQLLDHERMAEYVLVGGVGPHGRDGSSRAGAVQWTSGTTLVGVQRDCRHTMRVRGGAIASPSQPAWRRGPRPCARRRPSPTRRCCRPHRQTTPDRRPAGEARNAAGTRPAGPRRRSRA